MIRTRFAPSPTGYLHIGGARTALYCWLYARKMQGKFILRIEDTDRERSTAESVQAILDGLVWLGLDYDEGPYYQTQHMDRYREVIHLLLEQGKAYRCYCTKERLEKLREAQLARKEKPRYDALCRNLTTTQEDSFVIRFKNPTDGIVEFNDLIRGKLSFANTELDDLIIARSDGMPTYNFTVVVDDWDMKITHVIRGDDHINNTPRQINILRALGATLPHYAHVPMILGSDGKRLSKRHGAVSVLQYREEGFLPAALINYLVRLGWSHGNQEIFSIEELIHYFDVTDINRAPAAFNQEKLMWLNQHYIKTGDPAVVMKEFAWQLEKLGIYTANGPPLNEVTHAQCERVKTLREMAERSRYFYEEVIVTDDMRTHFTAELMGALVMLRDRLAHLAIWTKEMIHETLMEVAKIHDFKMGKLAQPVRIALTGGSVSPPIDVTIYLIGRKRVIERLNHILT
ncbi:MAG: glutamate--tRNA ligase [Gammaproteobacteria bacterium RIFCSPHIGHO2_12_FULL_37_34]|nr:MAG: glutamate--tRNA ligase [Gammaproteobacteria bacterium RIFCSPHIGHO2_12_FULL_37_34]